MKKTKIISLLLSMTMLMTAVVPGTFATEDANAAADISEPVITEEAPSTLDRIKSSFSGIKDFFDSVGNTIDDIGDAIASIGNAVSDKNTEEAPKAAVCEHCGITLSEGAEHAADCLTRCTCTPVDDVHQAGCVFEPVCEICEQVLSACTCCDECGAAKDAEHENTCSKYVAKAGETIWIYKDSIVYKSTSDTNGHKLLGNYKVEVVNVVYDENDVATWYEFKFTSLGIGELLLHNYKYVKIENTTVEKPDEPTDDTPTVEELEDGTIISVTGIPEDAQLTVSIPDTQKTKVIDDIANYIFDIDTSIADGGVFSVNYDIKVMQGDSEWQPEEGESVYVTIEVPDFYLDYRTYLQGIHILDTVDAIESTVESGNAISQTEVGLSEKFPAETAAAVEAGFPEDTIVYTIMLPETGDMFVQGGNIVINATSFSTSNITAFNVDNTEYYGEVEESSLKLDKTAEVDYTKGEGYVELSSYVKGEVSNTPTDVVLVIDQSGSMWTAVEPDKIMTNLNQLDETKGARRGYYVAFDRDTVLESDSGDKKKGSGKARLVRYKGGIWQVTDPFNATIYDDNNKFVGSISTCSFDTENDWEAINSDANYIYAVSISGALYEALNIFMDEMKNAVECRVAICTFAGKICGDGDTTNGSDDYDIYRKNNSTTTAVLDSTIDYKGSGIFVDGDLIWDGTDPTWKQSSYGAAFVDPSTVDGKETLYETIEKINTDYGSTPTALGLLYARRLFNEGGRSDSQKVAIVFTDGRPSPGYLGTKEHEKNCTHTLDDYWSEGSKKYTSAACVCDYCDLVTTYDGTKKGYAVRTTYVDQAKCLKSENEATVYSIGPTAGLAGVDVLANIATSEHHYFNAAGSNIAQVFRDIAGFIVTASQVASAESEVTDIISDSFELPVDAGVNDIEVYTEDYAGVDEDGNDKFDNLKPFDDAEIEIDLNNRKIIRVSNFEYDNNAVGMEGTNPKGKRLVVKIPIVVKPDFLGGNGVPTNKDTSGVYNGETMLGKFPVPEVDVVVDEITPVFKTDKIYLSEMAVVPRVANVGHFKYQPYNDDGTLSDKWIETYFNGINNAYVNVTYIVSDQPFDENGTTEGAMRSFTVSAKQESDPTNNINTNLWSGNLNLNPTLTKDATYYVFVKVEPTEKGTAEQTTTNGSADIEVYMPYITFRDSSMNLGQTANYDGTDTDNPVTQNYVREEWYHGEKTEANKANPSEMGQAPELSYEYSPVEGAFTEDTFVNVRSIKANAGDGDNNYEHKVDTNFELLPYATFDREKCENCEISATPNVHFIVHLNTFTLKIKKEFPEGADYSIDENQTFVFNIFRGDDHFMTVTAVGGGQVLIENLKFAEYTVVEDENWSWRYTASGDAKQSVDVSKNENGVVTVTFENSRDNIYWLSGDSYLENWWGGSNGTSIQKRDQKNVEIKDKTVQNAS